jgi:hypothetical protein
LLKLFHFSSKSRFGAKNKKIGESPVASQLRKSLSAERIRSTDRIWVIDQRLLSFSRMTLLSERGKNESFTARFFEILGGIGRDSGAERNRSGKVAEGPGESGQSFRHLASGRRVHGVFGILFESDLLCGLGTENGG